ncbi:MAG: MMPL family transporter [Pirellulaceae bacterium]
MARFAELLQQQHIGQVLTGRQLLDQLTTGSAPIARDVALRRLQGVMIGPDGRQTCVLLTLNDHSGRDLRRLLDRPTREWLRFQRQPGIIFQLLQQCQIPTNSVHMGGPAVDNVAIDDEGERTLIRLAGLAMVVGIGLTWSSLRSFPLTVIVFSCGLLAGAVSLSMVWLTNGKTDAILMSMPALVYVLAMSGAVHLINYYRSELQLDAQASPWKALAHGWKPAALCSVTTGMGLLSLCASDLTPIRRFGVYSATGVVVMLAVLFVYLPVTLRVVKTDRWTRQRHESQRRMPQTVEQVCTWIVDRHMWVTGLFGLLIVMLVLGLTRVKTSIDLMRLFAPNARLIQDYRWFEAKLGRLVPMEIVVCFRHDTLDQHVASNETNPFTLLERMEAVGDVQSSLARHFLRDKDSVMARPMSALTFVAPLPPATHGTTSVIRRSVANSRLERSYPELRTTPYLTQDSGGNELWRISIRVAAFKSADNGQLLSQMKQVVDPIVASYSDAFEQADHRSVEPTVMTKIPVECHDPVTVIYTGVVPIVYQAQRALLESLIESTVWSFVSISPVLVFVSRGMRRGMVAMLPNILPVLMVFGGMGWLGIPIEIGSMMSASIALGVAVDDTIHFLSWFRQGLRCFGDRREAILYAYAQCGTPTLQAALINGVGLSMFAFSTFMPTKQFGLLMLAILTTGAVAELLLLPALLAGPLGAVFQARSRLPIPTRVLTK